MKKGTEQAKSFFDEEAIRVLRELDQKAGAFNEKFAKAFNEKTATVPFMIDALGEAIAIYSRAKEQMERIHSLQGSK
ncbi:hypothetical protein ABE237_22545 [Brevibacillus formosus]|uniref:hypothetical protein n=1 Tax=Brevibacillus formosus TaxID=54913 RepID=UPI0018CE8AB7|nr:hypothetical protein [Brevibacillus formosus]MBG9941772.1 hypothetical protein [Brevibacillus formosus]